MYFFLIEQKRALNAKHVAPDCSARKNKRVLGKIIHPEFSPKKKKKAIRTFIRYISERETRVRKIKQSASFLPLAFHRGDDDRRAALDDDDDR